VKDAFHRLLIGGETGAVNPAGSGTKAAAHYPFTVPAGGSETVRVRLAAAPLGASSVNGNDFDAIVEKRRSEADAFFAAALPPALSDDERTVARQAISGMLWSKQHYFFDLDAWLAGHGANPAYDTRDSSTRNAQWFHMPTRSIAAAIQKKCCR